MADYLKTPDGSRTFPIQSGLGYAHNMIRTEAVAVLYANSETISGGNGTQENPFNDIQLAVNNCNDGVNTDIVISGVFRPKDTITIPKGKSVNIIGIDGSSIRGSMLSNRYSRKCAQEVKIYVGDICPQWIFVDGKARYPASTERSVLWKATCNSVKDTEADTMTTKIRIYKADAAKIASMNYHDAWVTLLHRWMSYKCRIESVDTENADLICVQGMGTVGGGVLHDMQGKTKRVIVENLNIDNCTMFGGKSTWQKGTYYVVDGYLHYKLTDDENIYCNIEIPRIETIVRVDGECNIYNVEICQSNHVFDNTCYEGEHRGYSGRQACARFNGAVEINGSSIIDRCDFHHNTNHCIKLYNDAHDCRISNNNFHDTGCSSIAVGFVPLAFKKEIPTSCPTRVLIDNNTIVTIGRIYAGATGIAVFYGADYKISNNVIRNTYYTGITTGYTWTAQSNPNKNGVIENNVLDLIGVGSQALMDGGGTYNLGNASGLTIRNNIVTNVYGDETDFQRLVGLYFDESSSNVDVYNNIVDHTYYSYMFNTRTELVNIHNNIFARPMKDCCVNKSSGNVNSNVFIYGNDKAYANATTERLTGNLWYKIGGGDFEVTWDNNPTKGNPFVDYDNKDYRIADTSLTDAVGFKFFELNVTDRIRDAEISEEEWQKIVSYLNSKWNGELPK